MHAKRALYTADFETTTNPEDCRVWAYAVCSIDNPDIIEYGTSIDDFMQWCNTHYSHLYFHNLGFDGEFIINWLFRNGYKWTKEKHLGKYEFKTLISDMGQFYSLEFRGDGLSTLIYDSLKLLPFSVDKVSKAFNLPIQKLTLDYSTYREPGHQLTLTEKEYIAADVQIMSMALKQLFSQGQTKMTAGSNALHDFKNVLSKKNFDRFFPCMDFQQEIRQAYKGGFTYLNPKYADVDVGEGITLDVNSLYPWAMYYCDLPYGEAMYFEGEYQYDKFFPIYVQMIRLHFTIKPDHIPCIQIKQNWRFKDNQWLTDSGDEEVTLCLTSVDWELIKEQYDTFNVEFLGGWKFMAADTFFRGYIDKWNAIKVQATEDGNAGLRTLAKLMLNSLYGKFALNPVVQSRYPTLVDGHVKYILDEPETRKPIYLPVAAFITAYARRKTITSAQACFDRFIYSDTDSLSLTGTELPDGLEIHKSKLGAWKHESTFKRARFIKQKSYIKELYSTDKEIEDFLKENPELEHHINYDDKTILHVTCSGMPDRCYKYVNWDNFHPGMEYPGKLRPKHVPGGIVLAESHHTIR